VHIFFQPLNHLANFYITCYEHYALRGPSNLIYLMSTPAPLCGIISKYPENKPKLLGLHYIAGANDCLELLVADFVSQACWKPNIFVHGELSYRYG